MALHPGIKQKKYVTYFIVYLMLPFILMKLTKQTLNISRKLLTTVLAEPYVIVTF